MLKSLAGPARTRFAPSPTGSLHIGTARTALYSWLLARQTGGQFILRIEDTDRNRYVEGSLEELMAGLRWLGLHWDEGPDVSGPYGPYLQSQRLAIYQRYADRLVEQGLAYAAYWSPDEIDAIRQAVGEASAMLMNDRLRSMPDDEKKRRRDAGVNSVIMFRVDNSGETVVYDEIRGEIRTPGKTLRDPVLIKSDGFPTYHLAAMVDDYEMKITHVLRAQEWLPSYPVHMQLIRALGFEAPKFIHPSVFLDPSGKGKMSKRRGSTTDQPTFVRDFRAAGYLPEAVINWAALMGWAEEGGEREFYSVADLITAFDIRRVRPSPTAVNYEKLDNFNGMHIRALDERDLARRITPFMVRAGIPVSADDLLPLIPLIHKRIETLQDAVDLLDFFFVPPAMPKPEDLVPKKLTPTETLAALQATRDLLAALEPFEDAAIETALRALAEQRSLRAGDLFTILRVALSNKQVAPPLFGTMAYLGRSTTLERLDAALAVLQD